MLEAGMKYFSAFSSKTTFPVLSETILIPTCPRRNSGRCRRARISACRSSSVRVAAVVVLAMGVGVGGGDDAGRMICVGVGVGCCARVDENSKKPRTAIAIGVDRLVGLFIAKSSAAFECGRGSICLMRKIKQ